MSGLVARPVLLALGGLVLSATLVPFSASAGEPVTPDPPSVQADVDGDGRDDQVTLVQASADTLLLRVGLAEDYVDAVLPGDARGQAPRAADLNGDGFDEVLVPESVGANTIIFSVWAYSSAAGLYPIDEVDGDPWQLAEGGGALAISAYGCSFVDPHRPDREVAVVNAYDESTGTEPLFQGSRATFAVHDGVATVTSETPVVDASRDDPLLQVVPAGCDPLP